MKYQKELRLFLDKTERCFIEGNIFNISKLIDEKFKFEIHFKKNEELMQFKGGKKEFIAMYTEMLARGDRYIEWKYEIVKSRLTLFKDIKAMLFFECTALRESGNTDKVSHIEKVVCSYKNGEVRLKQLSATTGLSSS